ncbi:putative GYF domain-containing protein [Helianthus annuus]|uniref:GYF domain-containing protein n=1 Tax=Helianthus annuus TaxID=4232 RepID=A0A9K3DXZ1_HELAN|nr:putative GYF domain-containing protein [Helianthus annuus]
MRDFGFLSYNVRDFKMNVRNYLSYMMYVKPYCTLTFLYIYIYKYISTLCLTYEKPTAFAICASRFDFRPCRFSLTLFEYLERKKLLQTPSEQSKLLTEVPTVTADTLEPEATPHELVADIEQPNTSPISIHGSDAAENKLVVVDGVDEGNAEPIKNLRSEEQLTSFQWWVEAVQMPKTKSAGQTVDLSKMSNVIDLCDDEEETHDVQVEKEKTTHEQEDEHEFSRQKWFYRDPQGQIQGPFSKTELKSWRDAGYFMPDFKVWKEGQTPEYAILLTAIL